MAGKILTSLSLRGAKRRGNLRLNEICRQKGRGNGFRTSLSRDKEVPRNRRTARERVAKAQSAVASRFLGVLLSPTRPLRWVGPGPSTHSAPRAADRRAFGFVGSSAQLRGQPAGCQNDNLAEFRNVLGSPSRGAVERSETEGFPASPTFNCKPRLPEGRRGLLFFFGLHRQLQLQPEPG